MTKTVSDRQLFAEYLVKRCNLLPGTAFTYEQNLRRIERSVGKPAEEITADDLERVFLMSDYHPGSKNGALVAIRRYHKFRALVLKRCELNGIMHVEAPRQIRSPKPALSQSEVRKLLDACHRSREYRLIYLGLFGGLRVSETASIGHVNWKDDRLYFLGKHRKAREVPLHPELVRHRDRVLAATTTQGALKHLCRSLAHYTGVTFTTHSLRRTFAVRLLEVGVQEGVVGDLMGHAPATVLRSSYAAVSWREKTEAIALLAY